MAGITLTERDTRLLHEVLAGLSRREPEPVSWRVLDELARLLRTDEVFPDAERSRRHRPAANDLTPRQLAVLALVREGCTNGQIGRRLHVSEGTVRTHLSNAYERLGVQSRTAAVAAVYRDGG